MPYDLQIITSVHNEEPIIAQVLTEIYTIFQSKRISIQLIVCEDGSTDNTVRIVRNLKQKIPIKLITSTKRKGYSRAVLDGLKSANAAYIGYMDSDGQYFAQDLLRLYEIRHAANLTIGYRSPRHDPAHRLIMSKCFKIPYRYLTGNKLQDPSSPCLIIKHSALKQILNQPLGLLDQGFWWEFYAHAINQDLSWQEIPINHKMRPIGTSDIYRLSKIPRIAAQHLRALFMLRRVLKNQPASNKLNNY